MFGSEQAPVIGYFDDLGALFVKCRQANIVFVMPVCPPATFQLPLD